MRHLTRLALLLLALLAPLLVYPVFLTQALCFAIFASAFDLLFGYAGIMSFGHAAFFGCGAYGAALVMTSATASPLLSVLAAGIGGFLMGGAVGGFAIRRRGVYLAMITLSLAEVVYFIALQARFTGGEDGLQNVPSGSLLGLIDLEQPLAMYFFVLALYVAGIALVRRIVRSPFGQILHAIRENESRAVSLGYRVQHYKLLAFCLSGALSGVAGGAKTLAFHFAALSDVYWSTSGTVILMTLLGGAGTLAGPAVGAFLVVTLQNSLAFLGEWVNFILGAVFVACVLLFRRGMVGELQAVQAHPPWRRRRERPVAADEALVARDRAPAPGSASGRSR